MPLKPQFYFKKPAKYAKTKPPKLRFRPGEFFWEKSTGDLYCIISVYRTVQDPSIWKFKLEARHDTGDPSTPLSIMCLASSGSIKDSDRIKWEPQNLSQIMELDSRDYCFGDRMTVTTQTLMKDFEPMGVAG